MRGMTRGGGTRSNCTRRRSRPMVARVQKEMLAAMEAKVKLLDNAEYRSWRNRRARVAKSIAVLERCEYEAQCGGGAGGFAEAV